MSERTNTEMRVGAKQNKLNAGTANKIGGKASGVPILSAWLFINFLDNGSDLYEVAGKRVNIESDERTLEKHLSR